MPFVFVCKFLKKGAKIVKKSKKLIIILIMLSLILFVGINAKFLTNEKEELTYKKRYAIMVYNGETYVEQGSIPKGDYELDNENTYCENGGLVKDYDSENGTVKISSKGQDVCYIYFNKNAAPVLAEHIKSLAEERDENKSWQVINEIVDLGDYTNGHRLTQDDYGTITTYVNTTTPYDAATHTSSTATNSNTVYSYNDSSKEWSTVPSKMSSGSYYYYFQFTTSESGYYQVCYNLSAGHANNRLYIYNNTTRISINNSNYLSADANNPKNGCQEVGYLESGSLLSIIQRAYTTISTLSFSVEMTNDKKSVGYRYEGTSDTTENWICLDELCAVPYRIIGVFEETYIDNEGNEKTGELVKIIRGTYKTRQMWNSNGTNDWSTATLKTALNATTGTADTNAYANLSSDAKEVVVKARWHLGNVDNSLTALQAYIQERNTSSSNLWTNKIPYVDEYVGLMYPSDCGYAVKESDCRKETLLGITTICYENNWMNTGNDTLTISPAATYSYDIMLITKMGIGNYVVTGEGVVRESYYLAPETKFTGSGKSNDPFYAFL